MGTQGTPFNVPKSRIIESIKTNKGVLSRVAKELDYAHETMLKHINKDPELVQILADARNSWVEEGCDVAEGYVFNTMSQYEDRTSGLKAAFFFLNNQGRKRGYIPPTSGQTDDSKSQCIVEKIAEGFAQLRSSQSPEQSKDPDESQVNLEHSKADCDKCQ